MIDITEESATSALPFMQDVISNRPSEFSDLTAAISFGVHSKQVRDKRSACVSIPAQLQEQKEADGKVKYVWRTDLAATMPFWQQWFDGLNSCFQSLDVRKWLFLANKDNLDNILYGGIEAGAFTMATLPNVGHYMHEDKPDQMA